MLLVINLPLIGLWVRLLKVPYRLMFTAILLFCCIGIYSINNNPADVYFTAFFGFVGYALIKLGLEPAPMSRLSMRLPRPIRPRPHKNRWDVSKRCENAGRGERAH